jgi:hypothetical protein
MPDFIENTFDTEETLLKLRTDAIRNQPRELLPVGCCHWCSEPLHNSQQLFCDPDCAMDWERDRKRGRA